MTRPSVGGEDAAAWIDHRLPPDDLYPEGFRYAAVLAIRGGEARSQQLANTGRLRLFPALPEHVSASFRRLRAAGAFLVSAEIDHGRVTHVLIESLRGAECVVVSPWPGAEVRVADLTAGQEVDACVADGAIRFGTQAGGSYVLEPK